MESEESSILSFERNRRMIKMEVDERDNANHIFKKQETSSNFTGHTIDIKIKVEENENIKVEESNILSFEHNCRMIKAETDERDDANDIVKRHETNSNFAGHTIDMKIKEENEDIKVEPKYFEIDDLVKREEILISKECGSFMENHSRIIKPQVKSEEEEEKNPLGSIFLTGLLKMQEKENDIDIKYESLDYATERFIENAECEVKNKFKDNLKQHFIPSHEKEESPRFAYEICSYEAVRKPDLQKHMAVQTCILCEASFEYKYQLDAHYVSAHPNQMKKFKHLLTSKVYQCLNCPYGSVYLTDFKNHLLIHEDDPMKLQGYDGVDTLKKKKLPYRQKEQFICNVCNKVFTHKHNLDSHILSRHKENDQLIETITNTIHQCPKCSYKTINITNFRNHLLKHGKYEDKFKFECNFCDYKSFNISSSWRIHSRLHTDQLPHVCTECNKRFNVKRELDRHIVSHHKENKQLRKSITNKVHQCPKCSLETINITYFKNHLLKHEKIEDRFIFECRECDYESIYRACFKAHLRLHTGPLPYKCIECNKKFNVETLLDSHILSQHQENEQLVKRITNKIHQHLKCSDETTNTTDFKKHLARRHEEASNSLY